MKIYTKTGDNGTTGLFAGPRVPKDHPRIQAYGTVDELNALLGLVITSLSAEDKGLEEDAGLRVCAQQIQEVQNDLFAIGAQLATPDPDQHDMHLLRPQRIQDLEASIDLMEAELPALTQFILPGGCRAAAELHVARTVCRRAERDIVALAHALASEQCTLPIVYLNRLSDWLFVLARRVNADRMVSEQPWKRPETT